MLRQRVFEFILGLCLLYVGLRLAGGRGWLKKAVLVAMLLFPWLSADYRERRVPRRQKCLACGNGGRKDLRFDPIEKIVIVQCPVCLAAWGYNPVVNPGKWAKPITEE